MTKKNKAKILENEIRMIATDIEIRSDESDIEKIEYIEGYALKFERWSEILGAYFRFKEIISRKALDNTDMSNVIALFNHKQEFPLARNTVESDTGKLELEVDAIGLRFRFKPTATTYANDLIENIRAKVVDKCSFSFSIDYEDDQTEVWEYDKENDIYERRLNKIKKIHDISIVTTPAYDDTEVVVDERSKKRVNSLETNKVLEKRKLELELDLLNI